VPNWRGVIRMQSTLDADVRVIAMPAGRDPDDVIRSAPAEWPSLVDAAVPFLDFRFDTIVARHDLSDARGRSSVVSALAPMVAAIPDRVVQADYVQRLARIARIDEATLRMELKQPVKKRRASADSTQDEPKREIVRDKREEFCIALLIRYPAATPEGLAIDANIFRQSENRALFDTWVASAQSGESFEESLTPDLRDQYERILSLSLPVYDDPSAIKALRTTVWGIEQQRLQSAKRNSSAVVADLARDAGEDIAERARAAWERGAAADEDDADPAVAFVEDMEAGLKVHQRILEQRRNAGNPAGEVI
jgi:DNA primase